MVQPKPRIKFTVKDYMSTPYDKRYQLLDGEMILAPSPTSRHQTIVARVYVALNNHVNVNSLGRVWFAPLDVVLSNYDVAQPDILFVSNARASSITEANIQGAPDLVVEILSPSTLEYDRGYKTVEILTHTEQGLESAATYSRGQTLESPLFDGLSLELQDIFNQDS